MGFLLESLGGACRLLVCGDRELWAAARLSLSVSGSAVALATAAGLPLACLLSFGRFPGRRLLRACADALVSFPSVAAGLLVYAFICRRSALGGLDLLYTPAAMAIGQFLLATPIIVSLAASCLEHADPRVRKTACSLGATRFYADLAVVRESGPSLLSVLFAAFGRVFSEVGASMMLGGNIRHYTRNVTTAMATRTSEGDFASAMALGLILVAIAFSVNVAARLLRSGRKHAL